QPASLDFPHHLLGEDAMHAAMNPSRLEHLRSQILADNRARTSLQYMAPWVTADFPYRDGVDLILSQAVMEHVENLPGAYKAMYGWLRPGGFASHQIDFRSHELFSKWDGHWAAPD